MTTSRWFALALLSAALAAPAAPLKTAQVPASAKWVLHVDVDQLRETAVGRALMEKLHSGSGARKLAALAAVLGSDLRNDLSGCTLYGLSESDSDGVALLEGRFNRQQLETLLQANDGYRSESYEGQAVHSWIDEGKRKRMFGSILPTGQILISGSVSALHLAMDVAQGRGTALAKANPNGLPLPDAAGASILVAAADMVGLKKVDARPNARSLQHARSGSIALREEGTEFLGRISAEAQDERGAKLMADIARGLLALAQMDEQADAATLEMVQAMQIEQAGAHASVTLRMPAAKAAVWLRARLEKDEQKRAASAAALE